MAAPINWRMAWSIIGQLPRQAGGGQWPPFRGALTACHLHQSTFNARRPRADASLGDFRSEHTAALLSRVAARCPMVVRSCELGALRRVFNRNDGSTTIWVRLPLS